jgi:DNA repair exonuclease SbcCD ATPase subunit
MGFLKKVAGAFVYLDEGEGKAGAKSEAGNLDEISRETNELLAQLNSSPRRGREPREPVEASSPSSQPGEAPASSALNMTADEVFQAAGLADTASSAQRVLKIIAGLSMFPRDQQIIMVRAMDAADETWAEKEVLEDARRRQSALRSHLQAIETERARRQETTSQSIAQAQRDGRQRLEDLDRQIAELQKQRQQAVEASTASVTTLEQEKKQTDEAAEKARRGITAVINALSDLITFFVGGDVRPAAKS